MRGGVKKMRGGGSTSQSTTKIGFLFRKEKKMQNVLKLKNMYFYEDFFFKCSFGAYFMFQTILDHLICIQKNDEKNLIFSSHVYKKWFLPYGSATFFFTPSLWGFYVLWKQNWSYFLHFWQFYSILMGKKYFG